DLLGGVLANRNAPTVLLSHSLGNLCVAQAVRSMPSSPADVQWLNFQAALPHNAFDATTGEYRVVSTYFDSNNTSNNSLVVVHSELDLVLTFLYGMATVQTPMGLYGTNRNEASFKHRSVIEEVGESHGPEYYFSQFSLTPNLGDPFD
ncbi:MAG: hypothetical protein JNK93_01680, partial [Planctomycetia bacterium]|nr:hypothetical protein [Planctomycetia bacterium]